MYVALCGRFSPNERGVVGYGKRIRAKYTAKRGVQMAGMNFQTRSGHGSRPRRKTRFREREQSALTFDTAACYAGNNLLREEDIKYEGRQEYNNNRCKHTGPVARILHGIDHGVQSYRNRADPVGVSENKGYKVFVPYIDKIKNCNSDDTRLCHRQHNQPERFRG